MTAFYHLPGLFEFYEFYRQFLPLYLHHRDWFYNWCEIGSIYGAPSDCLWAGGRVEESGTDPQKVLTLTRQYGISARLTFSNALLREEHLSDHRCNALSRLFHKPGNGIIITSDLLLSYMTKEYPDFYYVSSTTKVLTEFEALKKELDRKEFLYVVPDFRLNKAFSRLAALSQTEKNKVEFLCNECCWIGCKDRKCCYEAVSFRNLGEDAHPGEDYSAFHCNAPEAEKGYRFFAAMKNPAFISIEGIQQIYLPMGFSNFKIEGRGLGSALLLEFILYYMTKPEYQIAVRDLAVKYRTPSLPKTFLMNDSEEA